jgi:hypothetical protein
MTWQCPLCSLYLQPNLQYHPLPNLTLKKSLVGDERRTHYAYIDLAHQRSFEALGLGQKII